MATPASFRKLITLWVPRRFIVASGIDTVRLISEVSAIARTRGFVLSDGQLLTSPLASREFLDVIDEGPSPYPEIAQYRPWGSAQEAYFGLASPYQMSEDSSEYTTSHIQLGVVLPYLETGELILGLLHGVTDEYYFYCSCHCAEVVYTTRNRLVCIGCGAMHVAFSRPLAVRAKTPLTAEEWVAHFSDDGSSRDDDVEVGLLDYSNIEAEVVDAIWTTDQWQEAQHRFVFFARSPPDVIAAAIRGTESDPDALMEAGFTPMPQPPPPAFQVRDDAVVVDLVGNAMEALRAGVPFFRSARTAPDQLLQAIPLLFRAVELFLKARLQELSSDALRDEPNTSTVIKRLAARSVHLADAELRAIDRLRRLRNRLQHGTAAFRYRTGMAACRKTLVFMDRFLRSELRLWLGDALERDDWRHLLGIPEVAEAGWLVIQERLTLEAPELAASTCGDCGREALVEHPRISIASCWYCRAEVDKRAI